MNRIGILLAALVVLGLGLANIVLGRYLITPLDLATQRGAGVPWYIVWTMVALTVFCAVALGGFLVTSLTRKSGR